MGGLKNDLPITYWTFLIGALAIAGVPGLAGFFSKDEILFRTFAGGHTLLWTIGLLTSLLTAVYMFRLVFLAFHGLRLRARAPAQRPSTRHGTRHRGTMHRHLSTMRRRPWRSRSSCSRSGRWSPAMRAWAAASNGFSSRASRLQRRRGRLRAGRDLRDRRLMVVSIDRRGRRDRPRRVLLPEEARGRRSCRRGSSPGCTACSSTSTTSTRSTTRPSSSRFASSPSRGCGRRSTCGVIDGAVNGVAEAVRGGSEMLRRLQTGSVRAYAASLFLGVVTVLGYYLWR